MRESRDQEILRMIREDREANQGPRLVDGPSHYTRLTIEPAEYITKNKLTFLIGNIIKYASRAGHKVQPGETETEAAIRDLRKVIRCAEMQINYLEGRHVDADI